MNKNENEKRRRRSWYRMPLAQLLTLIGLSLMVLKAGFEMAKAIITLLQ